MAHSRDKLCFVYDIGECIYNPVSSKFLPLKRAAQTRDFHELGISLLVSEDGEDQEWRSVEDGLRKAKKAAVGYKHLHIAVSCAEVDYYANVSSIPDWWNIQYKWDIVYVLP